LLNRQSFLHVFQRLDEKRVVLLQLKSFSTSKSIRSSMYEQFNSNKASLMNLNSFRKMLIITAIEFHRVLTYKTSKRLLPISALIFSMVWFNELNMNSKSRIRSTALIPTVCNIKFLLKLEIVLEISTRALTRR
jgi:hypothetical protein